MLGFEDKAFDVNYEKWASLLHPDDRDGAQNEVQQQLLKGNIFYITFRFQKKDKSWIWIEARGKVIERDQNNMPLRMVGFHMDVSDVHKNQQILEERDRLLQKLSEQIPGVIYRFQRFADGTSYFPFASEHIWDIYEVTPNEVKESADAVFERIHPEDYDLVAGSILLSWEKLTQWECEYRVILPSRGVRWVRGIANPQRQPDKSVIWHGYIADITEQKKIEEAFQKAREDAENATRIKSEFLANMSHEIRTPLNAIVGLGGLLAEDELGEKQLDLIHKLNQSSQLLMGILNDILDYSKIEARKLELDNSPLSITDLLDQIYNIFSMSASGKGVSLEFIKDPDVPEFIYGDSLRLGQVITNIVSNAVKFTQEGSVSLHISQTLIDDNYVNLSINIKDTGIGMSEKMLENLFQPFTQEDSSTTRKYGGSGLGLSIVKHLVDTMDGTIEVQSQLTKGSTFTIHLRSKIASEDDISIDTNIVTSLDDFEKLHVLLVEDNPINQEVASLMCKRLGASVSIVDNGQKAIDLYKASPKSYNIILMDIQMPKMGGYEATQILRQMGCDLPIIALTAAATVEDKKKALKIGMNDHLSKPINTHALAKVLAKWFSKTEAFMENKKGEKMSIFQEDEALYKKLLKDFYKAWNPLLESLVQELQSPNEGTQKTIHTLKGVSGNLALEPLYELCVQIDASFKKAQPITKNQAQKFEKIFSQTLKNIELSSAKNEQSQSKKSNLDEAKKLYNDLYEALRNYDMVSYDFQSTCKDAFSSFVDEDSLTKWESAVDALDYESAKALMESWDIKDN
jgi:signal transduction histidine kinase/CheY-like chemotaxis protein/HPt (histidine-containing phosphotransfer) domain-containing protein